MTQTDSYPDPLELAIKRGIWNLEVCPKLTARWRVATDESLHPIDDGAQFITRRLHPLDAPHVPQLRGSQETEALRGILNWACHTPSSGRSVELRPDEQQKGAMVYTMSPVLKPPQQE